MPNASSQHLPVASQLLANLQACMRCESSAATFPLGDDAHQRWRTKIGSLTLALLPCTQRAAQQMEPCMGPGHQDPDYHPPIHPADMEDSDEDTEGPQSPSSAAGGGPGVFAGASARARLALAAAQGLGSPGALQALASGYSEVRLTALVPAGRKLVCLLCLLEGFALTMGSKHHLKVLSRSLWYRET